MKNLILIFALSTALVACNNSKPAPADDQQTAQSSDDSKSASYELDSLVNKADQLVDQTVKVRGYVTHTCKHSGKRCFISGESQKASMRVEAKGNIGGFNRELVGSKIEITGIVKERKLTKEYIDQMEKNVDTKLKENGSEETCQAEMKNISEMRAWMKEKGKDYYSIYYMDGQEYATIE